MAEAKLVPPKKKRRVHTQRESPFPVPIESITDQPAGVSSWFYYKGELLGDGVVIKSSGDINYLYKMGYFGKGTLSRSKPASGHRYIKTDVEGENQNLRVTERRMYIRHLNWRMQNDLPGDIELREFTSSEEDSDTEMEFQKQNIMKDSKNSKLCDIENETKQTAAICGIAKNENCDAHARNNQLCNIENKDVNWTNIEADDHCWGSGENKDTKNSVEKKQSDWMENADFWNESVTEGKSKPSFSETVVLPMKNVAEKLIENSNYDPVELQGDDLNYTENVSDKSTPVRSEINSEQSENRSDTSDNIETEHVNTCKYDNDGHPETSDNIETEHVNTCKYDNDGHPETSDNIETEHVNTCKYDNDGRPETSDVPKKYDINTDPVIVDPLCLEIEDNADLLVIEDERSDEGEQTQRKKCKVWDPVRKRDPYKINEFLHLTLEEAFFLSYGLGCLVISDNNGVLLDLTRLWKIFVEKKKTFLPNYIAYHHYRSTGWVPKSGLKYGTDFILYKDGPPFYHASYSVVVQLVSEETLRVDPDYLTRHVTWTSLAGLNRMTEHVGKELTMCYVIKPHDLTSDDLLSPACISQFKVQEFVVSRWVPSQERERSEEIP